jgi:hypothetical protein
LFYTTILAALMGYTRPCKTLARAKPVNRVMSAPLIIALVLQLAVIIVFQVKTSWHTLRTTCMSQQDIQYKQYTQQASSIIKYPCCSAAGLLASTNT